MNHSILNRLYAYSGLLIVILFAIGLVPAAHFLQPPAPTLSSAEIAAFYQENHYGILIGSVLIIFAGTFYALFSVAISEQMKRIEGIALLTNTQLIMGALTALFMIVGSIIFSVAGFRPERAPELILLLNDLAWISLIIPAAPTVIQFIVIGTAIFMDKTTKPIFPRWMGYFTYFVSIFFFFGSFTAFFKTGPLAWNGLLAYHLMDFFLSIWLVLMSLILSKQMNRPA
jgi:hypothetical protein